YDGEHAGARLAGADTSVVSAVRIGFFAVARRDGCPLAGFIRWTPGQGQRIRVSPESAPFRLLLLRDRGDERRLVVTRIGIWCRCARHLADHCDAAAGTRQWKHSRKRPGTPGG